VLQKAVYWVCGEEEGREKGLLKGMNKGRTNFEMKREIGSGGAGLSP
jgi:hypothetical protein